MLGKWLHYGVLEDMHNEFFVQEKQIPSGLPENSVKYFEETFWSDWYIYIEERVPKFIKLISNKAFLAGKYRNVIKAYNPSIELQ